MLYKIAYLQLKNSEDAKDIVQEVFYQYIKSEKEFESGEHEKAWMINLQSLFQQFPPSCKLGSDRGSPPSRRLTYFLYGHLLKIEQVNDFPV